jgi:hypothetical protein
MSAIGQARATLDELYRAPGKVELIGGRIKEYMATGHIPSRVTFRIARSLDDHAIPSTPLPAFGCNRTITS